MKKVIAPPTADINVQKALTDTQANIDELESNASDVIHREEFEKALDEIREAVGLAGRKKAPDINDVFRGGASSAHGYVPDPGNQGSGGPLYLTSDGEFAPLLDGALVSGDPGTGGSSLAQKVVEVHGSLAVTSALQAEHIRARSAEVIQDLTFGGTLTGTVTASQVSTTPVTGAQTFLSATDLQSDLNKLDTESLFQVMPRGAGGTSLDQRYINVMGSVGVVGSLSAHTLRSRKMMVTNQLDAAFIGVRAHKTTNTVFTTGAGVVIEFDATDYDTNLFHSNTVNPSRFTIPVGLAGYYHVTANISSSQDSTESYRLLDIQVNSNGTSTAGNIVSRVLIQDGTNTTATNYEVNSTVYLSEGDYIEFFVDSGQNCTFSAQTTFRYDTPYMEMFRIGT